MCIHAQHGEGDQVGLAGVDARPLSGINFSFGGSGLSDLVLVTFLLPVWEDFGILKKEPHWQSVREGHLPSCPLSTSSICYRLAELCAIHWAQMCGEHRG